MEEWKEKVISRLEENQTIITINRVPLATKRAFKELAEQEFCDDYGMTLKWLIDGTLTMKEQDVQAQIATLQHQIDSLRAEILASKGEKQKKVRLLNGKELGTGE